MSTFFSNPNPTSKEPQQKIQAKLLAMKNDDELWGAVYSDDIEVSKAAVQCPELLARMTRHAFFPWQEDKFLPPNNHIPQTGSRFARLCRDRFEIALLVLTDKKLSSQLDDYDIWAISLHRDDVKEAIIRDNLQDKLDERFQQYLHEKGGPSLVLASR